MGLFDSYCAVSGLSLTSVRHAVAVPLAPASAGGWRVAGEPVVGPPDRGGSLDVPRPPVAPFALIAEPVYGAIESQHRDVFAWLAARGLALVPDAPDGRQHRDGEVFLGHADARHRFAGEPWMLSMLDECARWYQRQPFAGNHGRDWLLGADRCWYGLATAWARVAFATREAALAGVADIAWQLFSDEDLRATPYVRLLAVERGRVREVDLAPSIRLRNGDVTASFADPAACAELYLAGDPDIEPTFEVDLEAVEAATPPLDGLAARPHEQVYVPLPWGVEPTWIHEDERFAGVALFAGVRGDQRTR
ncbi:hypothetical protein [Nannocystis radixulma]|uniref:Uncharacterized protein n=1 Tax=Nannocystis radixulma TaxID=2995305 RepID=A0ABT5B2F5_9BACT|nr:hypothetical protein [Nannocystis radixulma]MDC0667709.1 hypothetical protein [Nannocystis radixulma]